MSFCLNSLSSLGKDSSSYICSFQSSDYDSAYSALSATYSYTQILLFLLAFQAYCWAWIFSLRFYFLLSFRPLYFVGSQDYYESDDASYIFVQGFDQALRLFEDWFFCFVFRFYFLDIFSPMPSFCSNSIAPNLAITSISLSFYLLYLSAFSFKISRIFLFLKVAFKVLFFLMKQILNNPSHSKKSMSGSGFLGQILTILDSTFGGGLKLFFPTLIK